MSTTAFKCPCCGAELTFSSQSQKMTCEYCGTELDVEAVNALSSAEPSSTDMEWSDHSDTTVDMVKNIKKIVGSKCKIKAAGGIKDAATVREMLKAGADVIGTSTLIKFDDEE